MSEASATDREEARKRVVKRRNLSNGLVAWPAPAPSAILNIIVTSSQPGHASDAQVLARPARPWPTEDLRRRERSRTPRACPRFSWIMEVAGGRGRFPALPKAPALCR
jgi:hypothetical protein